MNFWYAWNLEDDHDDHDHIEPEKVFANPAGCPADTVINVFHLEKGEYVVEFETEDEDVNEFHLAALPMLGGHRITIIMGMDLVHSSGLASFQ